MVQAARGKRFGKSSIREVTLSYSVEGLIASRKMLSRRFIAPCYQRTTERSGISGALKLLFTNVKLFDQLAISVDILLGKIIEQGAAFTYHFQQTGL